MINLYNTEGKKEECAEGEGVNIQTTLCLCLYVDTKRRRVGTCGNSNITSHAVLHDSTIPT